MEEYGQYQEKPTKHSTDSYGDDYPQQKHATGGGHHQPAASSDLVSDMKYLAQSAQQALRGETGSLDKSRLSEAAEDVLDAASRYGKLDQNSGIGQYVGKAENYLHQYGGHSSSGGSRPHQTGEGGRHKEESEYGSGGVGGGRHKNDDYESGGGRYKEEAEYGSGGVGGGRHKNDEYESGGGGGRYKSDEYESGGGGGQYKNDEYESGGGGGRYKNDEYESGGGGGGRYKEEESGGERRRHKEDEEGTGSGGGYGNYMKMAEGLMKKF